MIKMFKMTINNQTINNNKNKKNNLKPEGHIEDICINHLVYACLESEVVLGTQSHITSPLDIRFLIGLLYCSSSTGVASIQ